MDDKQFAQLVEVLKPKPTIKQKAIENIVMVASGGIVTALFFLCWHLFSTNDDFTHANTREIRALKEVVIDSFSTIDTERKMLTDRLARYDSQIKDLQADIRQVREDRRNELPPWWVPPTNAPAPALAPQVNSAPQPPPEPRTVQMQGDPSATLKSLEDIKGKYQWKLDQAKKK